MNIETLITILGWLGSVAIFAGLYGVTKKRKGAFLFSVAGESAWLVKASYIHAWDLLAMTTVFLALALYGYYAWGKSESDEARQAEDRVRQAQEAAHKRHIAELAKVKDKNKLVLSPAQREAYLGYINEERARLGQPPLIAAIETT